MHVYTYYWGLSIFKYFHHRLHLLCQLSAVIQNADAQWKFQCVFMKKDFVKPARSPCLISFFFSVSREHCFSCFCFIEANYASGNF